MRVEIRDMLSMALIPESDSDRAIMASWSKIDVTKYDIKCHSHTWGDGRIEKMVFGYVTKPKGHET
jgi:hypothetical protein